MGLPGDWYYNKVMSATNHQGVFTAALIVEVIVALGLFAGFLWQKYERPAAFHPLVTVRVLFIGNSFTSVNDLPGTVNDIARSLGNQVDYDMSAPGGYSFSQHVTNQDTLSKINEQKWDFVVLQEQSEMPAFPGRQLSQVTTPYAVQLTNLIHQHDPSTKVLLYETWGYKNGDSNNCPNLPNFCSYSSMQKLLREGYAELATATGADEALVGDAWERSQAEHPEIDLYESDAKHPSVQGTYLTACVFYQSIFGKSPVGASKLSLSAGQAQALQAVAVEE